MISTSRPTTKRERQSIITEAVRAKRLSTQAQLLRVLRQEQITVNQSTLSRDLAELGIRKSGGRYVLSTGEDRGAPRLNYAGVVLGFTSCGPHLIVLSTLQGQAQPVALAIDEAGDPAIVATVAGDDTVFIATRNRRTQAVALRHLEQWFGDKHER
ncbi:MAG: hypothetical protein JSV19_01790 [Phycisphaerales bacterium]|nr:MAG: hypothetical protein JSV19_01790 [Phycisphaerales bacterium]